MFDEYVGRSGARMDAKPEYPNELPEFPPRSFAKIKTPWKGDRSSYGDILMARFRSMHKDLDPHALLAAWRAWPGVSRCLVLGSDFSGGYPGVVVDLVFDDGSRLYGDHGTGECLWFYADEVVLEDKGAD